IHQTADNRLLPRIACGKCRKSFRTQWATADADLALPRGIVVSERFEISRNFCNKLWNAARFVMLNLADYSPKPVDDATLAFEDRWILSRLATVVGQVTESLEQYRFADAARTLYDFFWDEFCSLYVEMVKTRFQNPQLRATAQRVASWALDTVLRLLHPMIPFITEEIWRLLAVAAPRRGLRTVEPAAEHLIRAPWPVPDAARVDARVEAQFRQFETVLSALREIRSRQNIEPRQAIAFSVRCDAATATLLEPLRPYFQSLACAQSVAFGPAVEPPAISATVQSASLTVHVDLEGLIDVAAETARLTKQLERLSEMLAGKQKKLDNPGFVARAPAEVVQRERESVAQLEEQVRGARQSLADLQQHRRSPGQ
ncbi:MAG: class I tRNA ligase family protein, partial [Planctomycetes bacterium]|nr:class I tRNA ligase family protein [Planctomycetota bacterium]